MRTAIFNGPGDISVEDRPKPTIGEPTDAVVRVVLACVCGSDLWFYRGVSDLPHGSIGHEFIGVVDQVGDSVTDLQVGDFVISPFTWSDGTCDNCLAGFPSACVHGGVFGQGLEGDGGQAEFVRVPQADGTLVKVPGSDFSDETMASLLALTDVMATGHHAAVSAEVAPGDTVAVVGDGAVGLCAVLSARLLGAERIIVLGSTTESRHALAREWGATDIITARGEEAVQELKDLTGGYGADAVLECVGGKLATDTAFAVAKAGAVVGRVGIPHDATIDANVPFFRNVGTRGGPAPARAYQPELIAAVLAGEINPGKVFDLAVDLEDIPEGYAAMDERRAIKTLVRVSELGSQPAVRGT
ncbi:zinc-dependent alcohol dehydrogenase family protein [Nocardioides sp. HDW12B]|uniref:zinc-dependent alcohol dehydrogenase family protein n=1 Tax=Nocardioides sp. HDW12B TaxID=2714939 RepID=UPI00140C4359|nr:zinc-dependent alcohol dehydrogenase family protein [Nocardioides sp. HDW12B]QIK67527.1 zinc-dependent alcohol dehydrogenase family protein [Nocardioides sp. HDW12B]